LDTNINTLFINLHFLGKQVFKAKKKNDEWIKIDGEETFPETHIDVLTFNVKDGNPTPFIVDFCFIGEDEKIHWDWGENNPTHWMPLPERPKQESKGSVIE
jgi:hypothetical protein